MALPWRNQPPEAKTSYVISQLEGERITIPGSKGVFRILASAKQTGSTPKQSIAVFQSDAVLSDAPGFHYHDEAHDVFMVTKGFLKLWNGDKCRIMGPGDFAYVPPKVIHQPELLGPHTATFGLIAPGDWVDFFRYVSEPFEGLMLPENDNRNIREILIPKVMAAKDRFDVVFQPQYKPPEVADFDKSDESIPDGHEGYYLRANTGPRWMAGGVMSRPFITTKQSNGKFAISSIESSKDYGKSIFSQFMTFKDVDHCFCIMEGALVIKLKESSEAYTIREGETAVIPAGQKFSLEFGSKYVRVWSFTSGDGIEALIHHSGEPFAGVVIPDKALDFDEAKLVSVGAGIGVEFDAYIL